MQWSFFFQAEKDETQQLSKLFVDLDEIAQAYIISSLSEFACFENKVQTSSCFDIHKIKAFEDLKEDSLLKEYYFTTFGYATITIDELSFNGETTSYLIYNQTFLENTTFSTTTTLLPLTMYDSLSKKNTFAILQIQTYRRVIF